MGNLCNINKNILIISLDHDQQKALLNKFKTNELKPLIASSGMNVETFNYKSFNITAWETSNENLNDPSWLQHYPQTNGIIYIIKSCDCNRFEQNKIYLDNIMTNPQLSNMPILISG